MSTLLPRMNAILNFICIGSVHLRETKFNGHQKVFNSLSKNPLLCTRPGSEFLYVPCGHVVTGDLSIVKNEKLRDLLRKGPKFREPVSFSWHQNFDIIMDACDAYARKWAKKEDVKLDPLSEWIKSIVEVVKRRIRVLQTFCKHQIRVHPSPRAHVAKFYGRLRLIRSVWEHQNFSVCKIDCNCNIVGLFTPIPFGLSLIWHFWGITFQPFE